MFQPDRTKHHRLPIKYPNYRAITAAKEKISSLFLCNLLGIRERHRAIYMEKCPKRAQPPNGSENSLETLGGKSGSAYRVSAILNIPGNNMG
jgi:hypothetical protein